MNTLTRIALGAAVLGSAKINAAHVERVAFQSEGTEIVGQLYLPEGNAQGAARPAVVVTGSWTSVKEQMPANYAKALAAKGYIALTFDFRGWGESGGDFRYVEDPVAKTKDIIAAAAFLADRAEADPTRVSALGICASAGYAIDAAVESQHIAAVAVVAPWLHDSEIVDEIYGGQESIDQLVQASREALDRFEKTGELTTVPAAGDEGSSAIMQQAPYYTDPNRGLIPEYDNQFNIATWEPWLTYDAIRTAGLIKKPLILVHSQAAAIPQGARKFSERMGSNGKMVWLDNATQFEFYDDEATIKRATAEVAKFLDSLESIETQDSAAIRTLIEAVATLADLGNFTALQTLYADEVLVDYTSLVGGQPELKSASKLMTEWANVLPGFDRTRHQILDIEVSLSGRSAEASAQIVADHWVEDLHWQVSGRYHYRLENDDSWRIAYHQFVVEAEQGTRDVFGPATANAKRNPAPYIERQKSVAAVRSFLESLEAKDMERFENLWAEDAVQDMPYSPEGFPKRVSGRENLVRHYANWPEISGRADFTSHLVIYPTQDPQLVFAEWRGDVEVIPTGRKYLQTYGGLFHVEKGKIALFREYYDPAAFSHAFGLSAI